MPPAPSSIPGISPSSDARSRAAAAPAAAVPLVPVSRVADLFTLFQVVAELSRPINIQPRASQTTPPTEEELTGGPANSPEAIARSATLIAEAAAALGTDPARDVERARILWEENLKQIARVQSLYQLPPLPFQKTAS